MSSGTRDWATLFYRNRHLLWLSVFAIMIGGLSSALSLPQLEDPRITNRDPIIITAVPGASAERVDALVTEVLENALEEIDEISDIESTSRAGVSVVSVTFEQTVTSADNGELFAQIRDKVGEAARLLPDDALEPVVDDKRDPAAFTLIVGVTWRAETDPQLGILGRIAEDLGDSLRLIPGTELVRIYGDADEEITVRVDGHEIAELGMSPAGIASVLARSDAKVAGGALRTSTSDVLIEVEGELDSIARVKEVPIIAGPAGSLLHVGDVADVSKGWQTPVEQIGLVDSKRAVLVAARVSESARVSDWARRVDALLAGYEERTGTGIGIERVFEQERYTSERLLVLTSNLLAGAGVILAAVFVIMGLRPALIVALALPLVVALTLVGWNVLGVPVHQMSIFGLIIALGLLIDNAIVVTDDVTTAKANGMTPTQAVGHTVRHLAVPLLASTITTALAFAPIMLLPGGAGDFVGSIGVSVVLAITGSFAIALTITAAFAGLFTRPTPRGSTRRWWRDGIGPRWLSVLGRGVLRRLIALPAVPIAIAAAAPAAGFAIAPTLGNQFFPPVDRDMFEVRVWMPSDASILATAEKASEIEQDLRELGGVERVTWLVGGSHPSVWYNLIMNQDRSANYAHAAITTSSAERTKTLLNEAQRVLDERHPGAQILARQFAQGPPVVADIEYRITGPNTGVLQHLGDRYRAALQAHPDVIHTQTTMPRGEPKLVFDADEAETRLTGVTLNDIARQFEGAIDGATGGSVVEDLEQLPVRVRFSDENRRDLEAISSTPLVAPGTDRWVSAAALGEFVLKPETAGLNRYNGERTNTIKAYTRNGALPIDITAAVLEEIEADGFTVPAGYAVGIGGASEQDGEATADLAKFVPILAVVMVATLVLAFKSVLYAAMLGCVALFSVGLGLLSTWSIGFPVSFNTILGTLGLIGVALNDSIVVLAAIRGNPRAAAGHPEAIVEETMGCVRHVLATTATTIGGFLPLLIFVGGDFWPSLAIVLAGGIAGASLVALLFIPGAYALVTRPRATAQIDGVRPDAADGPR